jgi:nicotinate-nucleotide pyrophosphorylase (carboxylating)
MNKSAYLKQAAMLVREALDEDLGKEDITGTAVFQNDESAKGNFIVKADGIVAGLDILKMVFAAVDPDAMIVLLKRDGDRVTQGQTIATVTGKARSLLAAERTALNFIQRMSGIATTTAKYVEAVKGTRAKILDTRKTAPGMRYLDKYAVQAGGGMNHRIGLFDMFLIKDNHIQAAGSLSAAVKRCIAVRDARYPGYKIEVETEDLQQVAEALQFPVDVIMLDNFSVEKTREAVQFIGGRASIEASGGVTLDTIVDIARAGVDFISIGALTHSVRALDISLDFALV